MSSAVMKKASIYTCSRCALLIISPRRPHSYSRFLTIASTTEASLCPPLNPTRKMRRGSGQLTSASGIRSSSPLIRRCSSKSFSLQTTWILRPSCALFLFNCLTCDVTKLAVCSDVGCKTVANMIKGKTPEEIRKLFNIVNDFTPEEEVMCFVLSIPYSVGSLLCLCVT